MQQVVFHEKSRRWLRPSYFPAKNRADTARTAKNFSFFQNFQKQVFKQHSKTRVLTFHLDFLEVKIKKSNTKRNQADKKVWEFANREKQKQTSYTLNVANTKTDSQQQAR